MRVRFQALTEAFHEDEKGEMTDKNFLGDEWIVMEIKPTPEELLSFDSPFDWQFWEENTLHGLNRAFRAAGVDFQVWNPDRHEFLALEESLVTDGLETALAKIAAAHSLDELIQEFDSQGIKPLKGGAWDIRSMRDFLQGVKDANFFDEEADRSLVRKVDQLLGY